MVGGTKDVFESIVNLEENGLSESDGEKMVNFIMTSFFRKYKQANYSNIKRLTKFLNAMSNFVEQIFNSKKFKNEF